MTLFSKLGVWFKHLYEEFLGLIKKLFSLKDTPHAIAGGVAIGMFMGFTPLFGVKTLLSLGVAYLLRCNPIAAVVSVSLHDVVTPLWPVLLRLEYDIGYFLLSHPHTWPQKFEVHHLKLAEMLKWTTFLTVGRPVLIGSLFLSTPSAIISYFVMLKLIKRRQARKA